MPEIPSVEIFKNRSLHYLRLYGTSSSQDMRANFALEDQLDLENMTKESRDKYINNHAWALVRLQNEKKIRKLRPGFYCLTDFSDADTLGFDEFIVIPPDVDRKSKWVRAMISGANSRNGRRFPGCDPISVNDVIALWRECGGRCAISGLGFNLIKYGSGAAKRPFAPSLDRIDPDAPYTRENCRIVLAIANFAMNSFGEETLRHICQALTQFHAANEA